MYKNTKYVLNKNNIVCHWYISDDSEQQLSSVEYCDEYSDSMQWSYATFQVKIRVYRFDWFR